MTRDEFILQKTESERRICRRVIPMGFIYSIWVATVPAVVFLAVLLLMYFTTEARTTILYELVFCVLLFAISVPAARDSTKQFARLAVKCPFCQSYFVFIPAQEAQKTLETGCCHNCGK